MSIFGSTPVFDCKSDEWPVHLAQLNNFFVANDISDSSDASGDKRRAILLNCMTQESYRLVKDLLSPELPENTNYKSIVKKLNEHFEPKRCTFVERQKFYEAKKTSYESLNEFAARLRGLASHCKFGSSLEMCLTDRFVLGLDLPALKEKLFREEASGLTMSRAHELARAVESAMQVVTTAASDRPIKEEPLMYASGGVGSSATRAAGAATRGTVDGGGGGASTSRSRCTVCGARSHVMVSCNYKNLCCDICGEKGHLKRVCPKSDKRFGKNNKSARYVSRKNNYIGRMNDSDDGSDDFAPVNNIRSSDGNPYTVEVRVRDVALRCEVDSGSAVSALPARVWDRYFSSETLAKPRVSLRTYDGARLRPRGLKICGCDCYLSAEWKSKNKIVARSGPGKGRGDIIVTTRAGGDGTSTVQFRGYHEAVGPMKESAVWVDEASPAAPWGRRPLSPATFTPPDPLGLAAEGDDYKLPEEELHELFPEGSGNLADENFEPGWYLLEHHSNTSFPDLMAGAAFLQRKVEGQKEGQLSFLKDNAGEVIDRLDRLLHIKLACDHDRDHDRLRLDQLQTAIRESIELSNSLFSEMLSRKQRVERTRAALTLLSRHKFLFQLPAAIDANVRKHDYEVVVNDYARVRNLFGGSRVKVFQKILSVIDKKMDDLKRTLHAKIVQMPISIQEQRKLIRLLNSLGWEGDAAWDAILSRKAHLDDVMNKVKEHFQQQEEKSKEGGCWSAGRAEWCAAACAALTEETRALWTLGRWYFGGELGGAAEAEGGESRRRFKELVVRSVEGFATHMRACVLGEGSAPPPLVRARLAAGLRHLRLARDALRRLDLPSQPLGIVEEVIAAYRAHGADTFLRAARAHVCALRARETWALHDYSPHGAITKLPELLQGYVEDALASIAESAVGAAPAAPASVVNDGLQRQLGDILHEFTAVLRDLVRDEELSNSDLSVALEQAPEEELTPPPAWRRRLLLTSSNAHRTRTHVLPQLEAAALRLSLAVPRAALEESAASLRALEEELVCVYLEHVGDPLVGTIEPSMYLCRVTPSAITDARPYVYEIINNVLVVHAEVDSVCSGVAGRCVREVCETVCEELARLAHASPPSCPNAALANTVDLTLLALAMHAHLSPTARNHLNEALSACACDPLQAEEHARKKENIVSLFKKRMELQLASLEHSAALV